MIKTTQKALKELVKYGNAIDISHITDEKMRELKQKEGWLDEIGYVSTIYGNGGMLLQGHNTKQLYAITSRTQAIYLI